MKRRTFVTAAAAALASPALAAKRDAADLPLRPDALRTPDARFQNLAGYAFAPHYAEVEGYRVHYIDEGPPAAAPVLMMHGEPTWAYLYRKMIPIVAAGGHRVIAPDLIGFGRSDKPKDIATHTYAFHVETMKALLAKLDLKNITLVCQDWGSLIGLRVAAEMPDRFARIVVGNGALPVGDGDMPAAFGTWRQMVVGFQKAGDMPIGPNIARQHGAAIGAGYAAPYPDKTYKAGPLALPLLVPITPDDPASAANRKAWDVFHTWNKPFLTSFSDGDPITRGQDKLFQERIPGARGRRHATILGAGHFLQEDKGEEFAQVVLEFLAGQR